MRKWKDFVKNAQSVSGYVSPAMYTSGLFDYSNRELAENRHAAASIGRGVARGIKEIVPGVVIDGLGAPVAGAVNGMAATLGNALQYPFTRKWQPGLFGKEYGQTKRWVKNRLSDPIRKAEMAAGGNWVKSQFDESLRDERSKAETEAGPPIDSASGRPNPQYFATRATLDSHKGYEDAAAVGTEIAGSFPIMAYAMGPVLKGGTAALGWAFNGASRAAPWAGRAVETVAAKAPRIASAAGKTWNVATDPRVMTAGMAAEASIRSLYPSYIVPWNDANRRAQNAYDSAGRYADILEQQHKLSNDYAKAAPGGPSRAKMLEEFSGLGRDKHGLLHDAAKNYETWPFYLPENMRLPGYGYHPMDHVPRAGW